MDPTIVAGGLKLVGGLLGGRKKGMTPSQSIMSSAKGARLAAERHGFNALTLLQNSNLTAGAGMDMGTPPLASLAVLGDIVEENWGKTAEDEDVRREHNKLQNELLRLEVDRARGATSVVQAFGSAARDVGPGAPALGGGADTWSYQHGTQAGPFTMGVLRPDQRVSVKPSESMSGTMHVRNAWTDEDGFWIPGSDGEPLDIWQLPVVAGSWAASEAIEAGSAFGDWLAKSPYSPIQKEKYAAPYGRDAYGRPLPKAN